MHLNLLEIPSQFEGMKKTFHRYFQQIEEELQRYNTEKLYNFMKNYLDLLEVLSRRPTTDDSIRTAIGVLALNNLGYNDFSRLARIFDRIIPQTLTSHVLFTSWVAGRIIHHPSQDKSLYVTHLFDRCMGWIQAHGRRSRHLAAAHMLEQMYANAGNNSILFSHQFQSSIRLFIARPSMQVIQATASAVSMFFLATKRYGRGELQSSLSFFSQLFLRLISIDNPPKVYAALKIFEQLILNDPDSLLPQFHLFFRTIREQCINGTPLIQVASYSTLSNFVLIDKKQFLVNVAPYLIDLLPKILNDFPREISTATKQMILRCPEFFEPHIPMIKELCENLAPSDPDSACQLPSSLYPSLYHIYCTPD